MAIEFRIFREPFNHPEFSLFARCGKNLHMQPVQFKEVQPNFYQEPALRFQPEEVQQLMDELWRVGLRPTEGTGSAGSLAATEKHLNDMRKIAFNRFKIDG